MLVNMVMYLDLEKALNIFGAEAHGTMGIFYLLGLKLYELPWVAQDVE